MMQLLSNEILDWVNTEKNNVDKYADNGPIGCFLEIYFDCPSELYDLHNDYPIAAEKIKVTHEMLSKYQSQIIKDNSFSLSKNKKRIPYPGNEKKNTNFITKT